MPIPDYQSIMLPLLRCLNDNNEHIFRETVNNLAGIFGLSDDERKELLPSGRYPIFNNRVGWAKTYLKKAGLISSPGRGIMKITDRGLSVLTRNPQEINNQFLSQFPEFVEFVRGNMQEVQELPADEVTKQQSPEELLISSYHMTRQKLADELLIQIKECSLEFFERLVVELLVKMGYGGSRKDAGKAIGRSGDSGIDGIIKEDRLGLDIIYIQAKR